MIAHDETNGSLSSFVKRIEGVTSNPTAGGRFVPLTKARKSSSETSVLSGESVTTTKRNVREGYPLTCGGAVKVRLQQW